MGTAAKILLAAPTFTATTGEPPTTAQGATPTNRHRQRPNPANFKVPRILLISCAYAVLRDFRPNCGNGSNLRWICVRKVYALRGVLAFQYSWGAYTIASWLNELRMRENIKGGWGDRSSPRDVNLHRAFHNCTRTVQNCHQECHYIESPHVAISTPVDTRHLFTRYDRSCSC